MPDFRRKFGFFMQVGEDDRHPVQQLLLRFLKMVTYMAFYPLPRSVATCIDHSPFIGPIWQPI